MEILRVKRSKLLSMLTGLWICSLISTLSLLDAAEYVRCVHIGICEFLELAADLGSTQDAEKILTTMARTACQDFQKKKFFTNHKLSFYSRLGNLIYENFYIQNSLIPIKSIVFYILNRYIHPYSIQKILYLPLDKGSKICINQEYDSSFQRDCLPSQTLKIITTSIIKS